VGVWTSGGSKMADEDITLDGKPLQSLRVADLKAALEQRNLSKSGQKNTLIKRLKGALMLENLQKSSTSHCGLQPNSQIGQEMSQNSFIQQYLAKQQELLRQRLEREAQQNEEANDSPAVAEDDEDQSEDNDSSIHLSKKVSTRGPFVDGISLSRRAGHPRLPVVQLCVGKRLLQQHSQPSATRSDPDAGSWDSSSLRGGSRSQDATVCLSPQDTRSPPLPSPPRAIASLSVRVLAQPPAVPRTNEEGAAPTEPGSAHPVLHLSRSAGGRAGPGPGGARRGSRAPPQPQQMPPSMPATFARSKRKLQPPQHIPPPQPAPAHHAPMQLRHPTPPPSPPPNLFPLPDTPKQSPPDTGEQEGEAARGPRGASFAPSSMQNKDSDSSSCSSSPEPSGKRKPGPLSLLVQKGKESADGPASSSKSPPHTAERKALQESKGGEEVRHFSTEERQPEGMRGRGLRMSRRETRKSPKSRKEEPENGEKKVRSDGQNSDSSSDSDSTSGSSSSSSSSEDKSNHAKPSSGLPVESKPSSSRRPAGRERVTCWPMWVGPGRRSPGDPFVGQSGSGAFRPPELVSVHRRFKLTPFSSRVTQSHAQKSLDNFKTLYLKSDKPAEMTPLHQANDLNNSTPCQMWKSGPSGPDHTTREVSPSAPAVTEMEAESESSVVPQPPPGTEPESREGSTDEHCFPAAQNTHPTVEQQRPASMCSHASGLVSVLLLLPPQQAADAPDAELDLVPPNLVLDSERSAESLIADPAPKTFAARKISLASNKTPPANADGGMSDADAASAAGRKRRWGSSTAVIAKKPSISITTDSLKSLIPDIKVNQEAVVELHPEELQLSGDEESPEAGADDQDKGLKIRRTVTQVVPSESHENGQEGEAERGEEPGRDAPSLPTHAPDTHPPSDPPAAATVAPSDSAVRRSISQQKSGVCITIDDPIRTTRQPSPSRGKLSNIVHVTNLVRPFTLGQLKELLNRTGTVVEEGFWIDKIKSHCFVTYATTEEAAATREALHRVKWPQSNPKVLHVDFCQQDELDFHKGILKPEEKEDHVVQPSAPPNRLPPLMRPAGVRDLWAEREKEMQRRERARGEREWDRDKVREFARPGEEERRSRSRSRDRFCPPAAEKADEPPAKLLDDLFLKTKAAPCIYWLPLTEEQVLQKVLDRTERQKERERRHRLKVREKDGSVPAVAGGDGERERGRDREGDKKREGGHRPRRPSEGPAGLRRSRSRSNPRDRRRGRHRSQHQEYSRRSESRS
uniref:Apoptotic chromatin condensation inducer 1b n=1 Tax=Tetraodon nigroviridis TaxID=99883 RepID=H3CR73_TETNG